MIHDDSPLFDGFEIFVLRIAIYFEDRVILLKINPALLTLNKERHKLVIGQRSINLINQFYQSIIPFWSPNSVVLLCVPPTSLLNPVAILANIDLSFSCKIESNICGFFRRIILIANQVMSCSKQQIFGDHKS